MFAASMAGTMSGDQKFLKIALFIFLFLVFKKTIKSFFISILKRVNA